MPAGGNHTDIMSTCCKTADVVSYYDDCGLYCLADGQTVGDLTSCLYQNGAAWQDVFCRGNTTATATAPNAAVPTSAGASVVAGSTDATATKSGGGSSTATGEASGGMALNKPGFGAAVFGLMFGALIVASTGFAAL